LPHEKISKRLDSHHAGARSTPDAARNLSHFASTQSEPRISCNVRPRARTQFFATARLTLCRFRGLDDRDLTPGAGRSPPLPHA
jgi:hypothetical protein